MKNKLTALWVCLGLAALALPAAAQQPGSPAYNSVYLPAHGAGDTRPGPAVLRWGAVVAGKGGVLGWATDSTSEEDAAQRAQRMCEATGALECEVIRTFANSCFAVASDIAKVDVASGELVTIDMTSGIRDLGKLRKEALKQCGTDCAIVRDGCSLPPG